MNTPPATETSRFSELASLNGFLATLFANTHRRLDILSNQLNPEVFGQDFVVESLAKLANSSRNAQVRILLHQPISNSHPLLGLQQRLNSKIRLQLMTQPNQHTGYSFLCGDEQELIYFNQEAAFQGFYRPDARAHARRLLADFDWYWQSHSEEDINLRRLYL